MLKIYNVVPAELKKNQVYVSHVGDGEYSWNVFGSIHTSLDKFKERLAEKYNISLEDIKFGEEFNDNPYPRYESLNNVTYFNLYYYIGYGLYNVIAYFSIQTIDAEDFPIGECGE